MVKDTTCNLIMAAAAIISIILIAIFITSDNTKSLLLISSTEISLEIIDRITWIIRVFLLLLILLVIVVICLIRTKKMYDSKKDIVVMGCEKCIKIINEGDVLKEAIAVISNGGANISKIILWGYSLNWASRIQNYIEENPKNKIEVEIHIPSDLAFQNLINDPNKVQRKTLLELRLSEWEKLKFNNMIKNISIYEHEKIPSNMGIFVDNNIAILGSYSWNTTNDGQIMHRRQPSSERKFLLIRKENDISSLLQMIIGVDFLCRKHDGRLRQGQCLGMQLSVCNLKNVLICEQGDKFHFVCVLPSSFCF